MSDTRKEKPLPKPPHTAFGRKKPTEHAEGDTLLADRLAEAMAEGKIEDFLKQELPDNEYARNLTSMMMGMTGMLPIGGAETAPQPQPPEKKVETAAHEAAVSAEALPEGVKDA